MWLGSEYGRWMVEDIKDTDVVYSFGIGLDYTWDADVAKRFGCVVNMFDPTPDSIQFCTEEHVLPEGLVFLPVAVGPMCEMVSFYHHQNPVFQTRSMIPGGDWESSPEFSAQTLTLRDVMALCFHSRIDVLKLCLGGDLEYDVVMSMFDQGIRPHTLCFLALHLSAEKALDVSRNLSDRGYRKLDNNGVALERWTWVCE